MTPPLIVVCALRPGADAKFTALKSEGLRVVSGVCRECIAKADAVEVRGAK